MWLPGPYDLSEPRLTRTVLLLLTGVGDLLPLVLSLCFPPFPPLKLVLLPLARAPLSCGTPCSAFALSFIPHWAFPAAGGPSYTIVHTYVLDSYTLPTL